MTSNKEIFDNPHEGINNPTAEAWILSLMDEARLDERRRVLDAIKMITEDTVRDLAECEDIVEWKGLLIKKIFAMCEGD